MNERLLELTRNYTDELRKIWADRLVSVVLFGSVARGEATGYSDIDLLVVAENLPPGALARLNGLEPANQAVEPQLAQLLDRDIFADFAALIYTPREAEVLRPLYLDLVEDAIFLYDRDHFFARVLERLKQSLQRLGARRLRLGKVRYWDLKPDIQPGEIFEL